MVQYTQLIYAQPSLSGYGGGGTEVIPESGDHRSNVPGTPPSLHTHTHAHANTHTFIVAMGIWRMDKGICDVSHHPHLLGDVLLTISQVCPSRDKTSLAGL